MAQVKRAREKVLKQKQEAGESAWKDWITAKKRNPPPPTPDKGKKRQPTLLSQDQRWGGQRHAEEGMVPAFSHHAAAPSLPRDAIWMEWKVRKEKELAIKKAGG